MITDGIAGRNDENSNLPCFLWLFREFSGPKIETHVHFGELKTLGTGDIVASKRESPLGTFRGIEA
jgi:hypothetical protein